MKGRSIEERRAMLEEIKNTTSDEHKVRLEVILEGDAAILFKFLMANYDHSVDRYIDDLMRAGLRVAWDGFLEFHEKTGISDPIMENMEWDI